MIYEIDFRAETHEFPKKIIWATDLHLDAADKAQHRLFCELAISYEPDIVLIGGDISNGETSLIHLRQLAKLIKKPLYFVLGNHDFYHGSIYNIRKIAHEITEEFPNVKYLTDGGVVPLSEQTALIGHDGWYDGRSGDFMHSDIMLNDYFLIDELKKLSQDARLHKLNQLGSEAADYLKKTLIEAFEKYDRVIILTHVPPFAEACFYDGRICDANWAPHFVGQATGEALEDVMGRYLSKQLLVLCGHTHSGNDVEILPNLRVVSGQTELGVPNVQGLILIN